MSGFDSYDFVAEATKLLQKKGYVVYQGNGHESWNVVDKGSEYEADRPVFETDEEQEAYDDSYDEGLDGFWFTLQAKVGDPTCGDTYDNEDAAWSEALQHYMDNSEVNICEQPTS